VLNGFTTYQGQWGVENATITGTVGSISPFLGTKMLSMLDDGLVTTQAAQAVDVSSYATLINNGSAKYDLSAFFNVDSNVSAAIASVYLQFFTGANYGTQIGTGIGDSITLDTLPNTWQSKSITGIIPAGTTWLVAQVYYSDASIGQSPGYVDATELTISAVPEPTTLSLLALGSLVLMRRSQRRA
jgi:hypothetical protein